LRQSSSAVGPLLNATIARQEINLIFSTVTLSFLKTFTRILSLLKIIHTFQVVKKKNITLLLLQAG